MKIEILYLAGCPHVAPARQIVEQALADRGIKLVIASIEVTQPGCSAPRRFAGSPTVLINGRDVEPAATTGIACRLYAGGTGAPSRAAVEAAIDQAMQQEAKCHEV